MLPALRAGQIWRHPLARAALRQAGDPALPADMLTLAGRLPGILDLLDRLPQTYAHGDASPQNLLRPAREPGTVIVIDWGFGSLLPIGFDLGQLLVLLYRLSVVHLSTGDAWGYVTRSQVRLLATPTA